MYTRFDEYNWIELLCLEPANGIVKRGCYGSYDVWFLNSVSALDSCVRTRFAVAAAPGRWVGLGPSGRKPLLAYSSGHVIADSM